MGPLRLFNSSPPLPQSGLRTIANYDLVMVMDRGSIIEMETPKELLGRPESKFYSLCQAAGKAEFEHLKKLAGFINKTSSWGKPCSLVFHSIPSPLFVWLCRHLYLHKFFLETKTAIKNAQQLYSIVSRVRSLNCVTRNCNNKPMVLGRLMHMRLRKSWVCDVWVLRGIKEESYNFLWGPHFLSSCEEVKHEEKRGMVLHDEKKAVKRC